MLLESYIFARRSDGVAWHLQGRMTKEGCLEHREGSLEMGYDCTLVQRIEAEIDTSLFEEGGASAPPKAGC